MASFFQNLLLISLILSYFLFSNGNLFAFENAEAEDDEADDGNDEEAESTAQNMIRIQLDGDSGFRVVNTKDVQGKFSDSHPDWEEFDEEVQQFLHENIDNCSWKRISSIPWSELSRGIHEGKDSWFNYASAVKSLLSGDTKTGVDALIQAAEEGDFRSQSVLGTLYAFGYGVPYSQSKSILYHSVAEASGSFYSKMALAYNYFRQQEFGKSVQLYASAAAYSIATNHILHSAPTVEEVRLSSGNEESRFAIIGHRGEDDENIQYLQYSAGNGNVPSLLMMAKLHYWGIHGVSHDTSLAFSNFKKAAELGDGEAMVTLGELYMHGTGVEKDYKLAMHWFQEGAKRAGEHALKAATGVGYLYARGLGVRRNYTTAIEYFALAARGADPKAMYYLGVMYVRGLGVQRNMLQAFRLFETATQHMHLAATYQLALMYKAGVGGALPNLQTAAVLFKAVAERGLWGALLRQAHEQYLKEDLGVSLLLYLRAADLGYEVAQHNAAWMLAKFQRSAGCVGRNGSRCNEAERHECEYKLWKHSSEQGNVQAALLIGDAYFYGKGMKKDLDRAAEAYRRAKERRSAQAMFNLGYMHEHGYGLPLDLHLAKRFYDEALDTDPNALLPIKLALFGVWLRMNHPDSFMVKVLDWLPEAVFEATKKVKHDLVHDSTTILVLLVTLLVWIALIRPWANRQPAAQDPAAEFQFQHHLDGDLNLGGGDLQVQ